MKCYKCGYVSFDYLSECKKCNVDLSSTRERLGISAVRPAEPFFLGALLKDYQPDLGRGPTAFSGEPVGDDLAEIELGDEGALDLDFLGPGDLGASGDSFPAQEQMRDELSSARKVLEEIEKPDQPTQTLNLGDDMELDLDTVLEAATAPGVQSQPKPADEVLQSIPSDTEIDLTMEDLEPLIEGEESLAGIDLELELGPDTADTLAVSPDEVIAQDESLQNTVGDMVIELSSDDLENLLEDLEEVPKDKKS